MDELSEHSLSLVNNLVAKVTEQNYVAFIEKVASLCCMVAQTVNPQSAELFEFTLA